MTTCRLCGTEAAPPRHSTDPVSGGVLGWACERTADGPVWTCPSCVRRHLRDIEAKLPDEWWSAGT